uniref:Uncharacterized protein n=2 Tax=Anopheles arabiensis TaxID=7173 RepID=A0A182IHR5_ANOAR
MFDEIICSIVAEPNLVLQYFLAKRRRSNASIKQIYADRTKYGEFHTLFNQLLEDEVSFFQYMRMPKETFFYILNKIAPSLAKKKRNIQHISLEERLMVTLR